MTVRTLPPTGGSGGPSVNELSIATPHHSLKAQVAVPAGTGPWPGVVVIHDALGMSPVAQKHADWLASQVTS